MYIYVDNDRVEVILEELRNSLASISHPSTHANNWTERKEQIEQSWENHCSGIFENIVSAMALPSGAVCKI